MAEYEVRMRGNVTLGEIGSLDLAAAKDHLWKTVEAASPEEAATQAVAGLSAESAPYLMYVRDRAGGVSIFWPDGRLVTYRRQGSEGVDEGYCFAQATEGCVGKGIPEADTAVFADLAFDASWVCDPCAAVVAPGI